MDPIFLDTDADSNLIIMQMRKDDPASRIVLTRHQVNTLVDILLGPERVFTDAVEMCRVLPPEKQN